MHSTTKGEQLLTMRGEGRDFFYDIVVPGVIAGLVGGTLLLAVYMSISATFGQGWFHAPRLISGLYYRSIPGSASGIAPILVGIGIHYAVAIALATLFAGLMPRTDGVTIPVMMMAILFSMISYTMMVNLFAAFLVRPFPGAVLRPGWMIGHLAFGIALGLIPVARRLHHAPAAAH